MPRITKLVACIVAMLILLSFVFVLGFRPAVDLKSDGYFKAFASNQTTTAFSLTEGRTTTRPTGMVQLRYGDGQNPRYVTAMFCGTGSATQTFDYKVWLVSTTAGAGGTIEDYCLHLLSSGTATLGTSVGVGTLGFRSTDLIADTLTTVTSAFGAAAVASFGGVEPRVYSPGSNGHAVLFIPETCNAFGMIFEFDMTGASSANVIYQIGV
jgi:hypothetical protein